MTAEKIYGYLYWQDRTYALIYNEHHGVYRSGTGTWFKNVRRDFGVYEHRRYGEKRNILVSGEWLASYLPEPVEVEINGQEVQE